MPTTKRRIQVTVTDDVEHALKLAAAKWPGLATSELVARLAVERGDQLAAESSTEARQSRLRALRGTFDDAFPANYLEELRADWPQ